jgi:acetyl-CoA acyltransferase
MSTQIQEAYIVAATRTPVGKAKGQLATTRPDDLLASVMKALRHKVPNIDPSQIDDVIIGCAMPEGAQGMNVARIATLLANLPHKVPAVTVNRFCSSGLQTIAMAADRIRLGEADMIIAGGTESMSMVPMGGFRYEPNPLFFDADHSYESLAFSMGITAEKVAEKWQISREEQDLFALSSHQKALDAIKHGWFSEEITPIEVVKRYPDLATSMIHEKRFLASVDEGPREDSSLAALAKLRPVFDAKGSVTAGNSSQMSDGAAALLVVSEKILKEYDLTPMAKFCGFAVAGVEPEYMGIGPVEAIPLCLQRAGLRLEDIDWIELNEAFAAQSLAVMKTLNLDPTRVNPEGGAIALGHPLGATGAIRATTLLYGLQRKKQRYGMVTMCIGTGMGAAGIFEVF